MYVRFEFLCLALAEPRVVGPTPNLVVTGKVFDVPLLLTAVVVMVFFWSLGGGERGDYRFDGVFVLSFRTTFGLLGFEFVEGLGRFGVY